MCNHALYIDERDPNPFASHTVCLRLTEVGLLADTNILAQEKTYLLEHTSCQGQLFRLNKDDSLSSRFYQLLS
jgi:hypothetical protein